MGQMAIGLMVSHVFGTAVELEHLSRAMVVGDYTLAVALEDFRASVPRRHGTATRRVDVDMD